MLFLIVFKKYIFILYTQEANFPRYGKFCKISVIIFTHFIALEWCSVNEYLQITIHSYSTSLSVACFLGELQLLNIIYTIINMVIYAINLHPPYLKKTQNYYEIIENIPFINKQLSQPLHSAYIQPFSSQKK